MTSPDRPIALLVLGLGNLLCGDDGVGPAAINLLSRRFNAPDGVRVVDGGTLGLSLLPYLEDAQQVLLVDAIRANEPPGSFIRIEGDDVGPAVYARLSVHQVGVADLLNGARWLDRYPARLTLIGLVPASIELGLERSVAVESRLPALVDQIVAEARHLGYEFRPKGTDEAGMPRSISDVARLFGLS